MNKHHFFGPEDIAVFDLDQIYMTSSLWHDTQMRDAWGTFDLLVRDMPAHRNFLVFGGLEEMLLGIQQWNYTPANIRLLQKDKLISSSFASYLRDFRFMGDVHAMPEGTFFFPGEPVVRITAPLIQANLLTAFLMTSLSSNTIFTSKFIRCVIAAGPLSVIGPSPVRAQSFESSYKAQRAAHMVGSKNIGVPIVRDRLGIQIGDNATIAYHAFIKSYDSEHQAMEAAAKHAKVDLSLMIDTYNVKNGLANAMRIADHYKKAGKRLKIVIDSGDLIQQSRYCRRVLDRHGHRDVKITVASNLNEYKIAEMRKKGAKVNTFIVNTEAVTSADDPKLEVVYKIAEIEKNGLREYKMKLSKGKVSLPGRKQVYRVFRRGKMAEDVLGLEGEKGLGKPLLRPVISRGKSVYALPAISKSRTFVERQLKTLPPKYHDIHREHVYPVRTSAKLNDLVEVVKAKELSQYYSTE